MCQYEQKVGCLNCPLPDCMANGNGHLAKKYLKKQPKKKTEGRSEKKAVFRKMGFDV